MSGTDARVLGLLGDARRQLQEEREYRSGAIAIVGMGCRFPGAADPSSYWQLLERGVDATRDVPTDRWDNDALYDPDPAAPGKVYVRRGGFLDRIDGFDPSFFGISPREARGMDPQQRLLLEVTWEALEDAGIVPARLERSATGVWIGLCLDDYARLSVASGELERIDPYNALGTTRSIAAGRIAYVLDLRGPAVQIDTSCSSSLVAVHQACQSLRARETNLALVGGVNLMSAPDASVALCKLRALAPDGRCKTFDASADGYSRGEGCGIVVLKRLNEAVADGDRIHAVIRGVASNHDGRSNGLTAPNGLAQEAVIRMALANANLDPALVSYVEAHGTGTLLGDPIEVLSLARVYGQARQSDAPLHLGSVKTNFGHLEGAAGIAGLIKLALCLSRRRLVPHLHVRSPNPRIPWAELPLHIVTQAMSWDAGGAALVAGLSSFGLSGTNAHAILSEAPTTEPRPAAAARTHELIVLSAHTSAAARASAGRLLEHVEKHRQIELGALARSLASTRAELEHRLAFVVPDRAALLEGLRLAREGETPAHGARSLARSGPVCFLFTGQGAQRPGMGQATYAAWPVFHDALDAAFDAINPHLERPLQSVMWAAEGSSDAALLDQTAYTQPALFALEWALASLWRSFGAQPSVLLGHSIGEIVAACVAGVFSLTDAARLVCARGRLMQALPASGAMYSVAAPLADVARAIEPQLAHVSIAASNGPSSVVIAGAEPRVVAIAQSFAERGVSTRRLTVSHAFHSPLMDPMLDEFRQIARSVRYAAPELPVVSNASGMLAGSEMATPDYWVDHVRSTVRFAEGVTAAVRAGATTFIEVGPRATLLGLVEASSSDERLLLLPALRSSRPELESLLESVGAWSAARGSVQWAAVFPHERGRVDLPTYPWQRQRFWLDDVPVRAPAPGATRLAVPAPEPVDWFALEWQAANVPPPAPPAGRWVVVTLSEIGSAERLCAELALRHVNVECVRLAELKRGLRAEHVVCAWPATSGADAALAAASEGLALVQALVENRYEGRLWLVTEQAVATASDDPIATAGSTLWGLGRTLMQEQPEIECHLLDVERGANVAERLLCELGATDAENQIAWRRQQRFAARLVRRDEPRAPARAWRPGSVLISGGLGSIGALVARHLARRGIRHLVLASRSAASAEARETQAALEALGARVTLATLDVTDRDALAHALGSLPANEPLRAVIHAAGVLDDGPLSAQTPERFARVMAPKALGACHLDELTRDADLDAFIVFSSLAGTLGAAGQGAYAPANAFLDALMTERRQRELPALSLVWGPWAQTGLAAGLESSFARRGIGTLAPERALDQLSRAEARGESPLILARFDLPVLERTFADAVPSVWRSLVSADRSGEAAPLGLLPELPAHERAARVSSIVRQEALRVLSMPSADALPVDKPLVDLGLDSLMAVELRSALGRRLGVFLPASLLQARPTLANLEQHILEHASGPSQRDAAANPNELRGPQEPTSRAIANPDEPVAEAEQLTKLDAPVARLFCFHDAGGSPALFAPLAALAERGVEVHTLSHARRAAPSEANAAGYLDETLRYIRRYSNRPYVLLGHSLGGLIAWRLARELAAGAAPPALLVVSAIDPAGRDAKLSEGELGQTFARIFGERASSAPHLERDFVADMKSWQALPQTLSAAELRVPIAAFAGRDDHIASEASMQRWADATSADFSLSVLPGNHFYLADERARRVLLRALSAAIGAQLVTATSDATDDRTTSTTQYW